MKIAFPVPTSCHLSPSDELISVKFELPLCSCFSFHRNCIHCVAVFLKSLTAHNFCSPVLVVIVLLLCGHYVCAVDVLKFAGRFPSSTMVLIPSFVRNRQIRSEVRE